MNSLYVISAIGKDKPGLVHSVSQILFDLGINIVDVQANSIRGHFLMFLIADLTHAGCSYDEMLRALEPVSSNFKLGFRSEPYDPGRRNPSKQMMALTAMGIDRPGIIANISGILSAHQVNIESVKMIARGEYIVIEMSLDASDAGDPEIIRDQLYAYSEGVHLDISLREDNIYIKPKRVVVFDCDSTLIKEEVIDELAKAAGVGDKVRQLTSETMNGDVDFAESLQRRIQLLKGLSADQLKSIARSINLTPGAEELISVLRFMGYKVAVISGGFSFFTDTLKESLQLDYVFANELEIVDGVVTGNLKGEIIDAEKKGEIIKKIAALENISVDQIVAVGDGANDRFMLQNSGLAIAFNPKEVLKKYSDGIITSENISGLLCFLGLPEKGASS